MSVLPIKSSLELPQIAKGIEGLDAELEKWVQLHAEVDQFAGQSRQDPERVRKMLGTCIDLERITPEERDFTEKAGRLAKHLEGTGLKNNRDRANLIRGRMLSVEAYARMLRGYRAAFRKELAPPSTAWEWVVTGFSEAGLAARFQAYYQDEAPGDSCSMPDFGACTTRAAPAGESGSSGRGSSVRRELDALEE